MMARGQGKKKASEICDRSSVTRQPLPQERHMVRGPSIKGHHPEKYHGNGSVRLQHLRSHLLYPQCPELPRCLSKLSSLPSCSHSHES